MAKKKAIVDKFGLVLKTTASDFMKTLVSRRSIHRTELRRMFYGLSFENTIERMKKEGLLVESSSGYLSRTQELVERVQFIVTDIEQAECPKGSLGDQYRVVILREQKMSLIPKRIEKGPSLSGNGNSAPFFFVDHRDNIRRYFRSGIITSEREDEGIPLFATISAAAAQMRSFSSYAFKNEKVVVLMDLLALKFFLDVDEISSYAVAKPSFVGGWEKSYLKVQKIYLESMAIPISKLSSIYCPYPMPGAIWTLYVEEEEGGK